MLAGQEHHCLRTRLRENKAARGLQNKSRAEAAHANTWSPNVIDNSCKLQDVTEMTLTQVQNIAKGRERVKMVADGGFFLSLFTSCDPMRGSCLVFPGSCVHWERVADTIPLSSAITQKLTCLSQGCRPPPLFFFFSFSTPCALWWQPLPLACCLPA